MDFSNVIFSTIVSFGIAWMGWSKLEKRTERTSNRSESFSLLTPTIALIGEIKKLAEEQLAIPQILDMPDDDFEAKAQSNLKKRQAADIKFHTKYQLLRTKLKLLEQRNIRIPNNLLVELRKAYTSGPIDDVKKLHKAFTTADRIDMELYTAFERVYPKPEDKPWCRKLL